MFLLFILFITVKGLEHSDFLLRISQCFQKGSFLPLKLVMLTFFLSMVITNDVSLIVIVPLTLMLDVEPKDIIVILEALAANAGSALTPFGNPQNLFIYWFYQLSPGEFIKAIAPFSLLFFVLLLFFLFFIKQNVNQQAEITKAKIKKTAYIYLILLCAVILIILRVLPFWTGFITVIYVLLFDRKSLKIDYALLITFFLFFGLAGNMKILLGSELTSITSSGHIFLLSAIVSQFMSNVPAALMLAKITTQWKALLWGTSVGGFGSLVGSLANLIAYRFYIRDKNTNNSTIFTLKFLVIGYAAFFLGVSFYFLME